MPETEPELKKRSVIVAGHRTSVSLEAPFWSVLREIAEQRGLSLNDLITEIDRTRKGNLSSAIRIHILDWLQRGTPTGSKP